MKIRRWSAPGKTVSVAFNSSARCRAARSCSRLGKAAQFIPIRFTCFNKLTRDDKLLLSFDACVLAAALGREITAASSFTATTTPR